MERTTTTRGYDRVVRRTSDALELLETHHAKAAIARSANGGAEEEAAPACDSQRGLSQAGSSQPGNNPSATVKRPPTVFQSGEARRIEADSRLRIAQLKTEISTVQQTINNLIDKAEREEAEKQAAIDAAAAAATDASGTGRRARAVGRVDKSTGRRPTTDSGRNRSRLPPLLSATSMDTDPAAPAGSDLPALPLHLQVVELEAAASSARTIAMRLAAKAGEHLAGAPAPVDPALTGKKRRSGSAAVPRNPIGSSRSVTFTALSSAAGLVTRTERGGAQTKSSLMSRARPPSAPAIMLQRPTGSLRAGSGAAAGWGSARLGSPTPAAPLLSGFLGGGCGSIRQRKLEADLAAAAAEEEAALAFRFIASPVPPTSKAHMFAELLAKRAAARRKEHAERAAKLAEASHSFPGIDAHCEAHRLRLEAHRQALEAAELAAIAAAVKFTALPAPPTTYVADEVYAAAKERAATRKARLAAAAAASVAASALPPRVSQAVEEDAARRAKREQARQAEEQEEQRRTRFRSNSPPDFRAAHAGFLARLAMLRGPGAGSQAASLLPARPASAPGPRGPAGGASSLSYRNATIGSARPAPRDAAARLAASASTALPAPTTRSARLRVLEIRRQLLQREEAARVEAERDEAYASSLKQASARIRPIVATLEAQRLKEPLAWQQASSELARSSQRRREFEHLSQQRQRELQDCIRATQEALPLLMLRQQTRDAVQLARRRALRAVAETVLQATGATPVDGSSDGTEEAGRSAGPWFADGEGQQATTATRASAPRSVASREARSASLLSFGSSYPPASRYHPKAALSTAVQQEHELQRHGQEAAVAAAATSTGSTGLPCGLEACLFTPEELRLLSSSAPAAAAPASATTVEPTQGASWDRGTRGAVAVIVQYLGQAHAAARSAIGHMGSHHGDCQLTP